MHSHLSFLQHGEGRVAFLGGDNGEVVEREPLEVDVIVMQANVVTYLQSLTSQQKAAAVDIQRELGIDLVGAHKNVLDLLKSNPKVVVIEDDSESFYLKYLLKFEIHNETELLNLINRVKTGISRRDLNNSYPGIDNDIKYMLCTGKVIACKNKERDHKDIMLYPRGTPFYTELSGTITATPGVDSVHCSVNNMHEIRRGDVMLVYGQGFRVDMSIVGSKSSQPERAKPPLTASSLEEHDKRGKNEYFKKFTESLIPLDGDYDGDEPFVGKGLKHGCTNDIREMWHNTATECTIPLGPYTDNLQFERNLEAELIRLGLLTRPGSALTTKAKGQQSNKQKRMKVKKPHKWTRESNTHLEGTALGQELKMSRNTFTG